MGAALEALAVVVLVAAAGTVEGLGTGVFPDCAAGVCDAPGWPFGFCGGLGVKYVHKNRIADDNSNASISRFVCIQESTVINRAASLHWIVTTWIKRMTPQHPTHGKPTTTSGAVPLNRSYGIFGTRGNESTRGRQ